MRLEASKHVDENRFGARVVDVRAPEVDAKIFEGGFWRVLTFSRSLAPNAIGDDALAITVSGDKISICTIASSRRHVSRVRPLSYPTGVGIVE